MNDVFTWPVGRATAAKIAGTVSTAPPLRPIATYVVATTLAGALAGTTLSALGQLVGAGGESDLGRAGLVAVLLVIAGVAVLLQAVGIASALPQRAKQVPRHWLAWSNRAATAGAWGLLIGAGFLTPLRFAAMYVLAAVVMLAPDVATGCLVGAVYGCGRGVGLLATWWVDVAVGRRLEWERLLSSHGLNLLLAGASAASMGLILASGTYL